MPLLKSRRNKVIVAIVLVMLIVVGAAFGYLWVLVNSLNQSVNNPALPSPTISGYLYYQGLLSYNNGSYEYPYVSVEYNATNAYQIYANASVYEAPLPQYLYVLNYSADCWNCGNAIQAVNAILSGVKYYGMQGLYSNYSYVYQSNLATIHNNSILVILNGLLPSQFETANYSLMNELMAKHVSIIYVGLNFSSVIVPGIVPTQEPSTGLPSYLYTKSFTNFYNITPGAYTFNAPTFQFTNGSRNGFVLYKSVNGGSIVAFPNTLSSWPSEQAAGDDIAKAIWQMFWLPRYSYGGQLVPTIPKSGLGSVGVVMNGTEIPYSLDLPQALNSGYLRVVVQAAPLYSGKLPAYLYIGGQPRIGTRGVVSIAPQVAPNQSAVRLGFNITSKPGKPINLSTAIWIYNQNLTPIISYPGPDIHNFSSASPSFSVRQNMEFGPGRYIIMLRNFSDNTELAGGYFVIPKYNISLSYANLTAGIFVFHIRSGKLPLNNVAYNLTVDRLYPSTGVAQAGVIEYKLPQGAPQLQSPLNFTISMLGQQNHYQLYYSSLPFAINSEYIEVLVVIVMILIMVVFVRAPIKDEFYVDVPNLPESKKVDIKVKAKEVLDVFDKLNSNYHWKYMPLSKTEIKSAIAINLKYNNIPVELTYRNIDTILDSLVVNKYVVSEDELYAPKSWIADSKHDIGYLATFKKLRIYFVTHNYVFTDIDISDEADMTATLHGEKRYFVIYSGTSKFKNIPVYPSAKTHLVFINEAALQEFKDKLYNMSSANVEKLKMYISADYIRLVDADSIDKTIS